MNDLVNKLYDKFDARNKQPYPRRAYHQNSIREMTDDIIRLSSEIENTYPLYSKELFNAKNGLFYSGGGFDSMKFGVVFTILKALKYDVDNGNPLNFWQHIHSDIAKVSYQLFVDGHYYNAVDSAYKEICSRVRKLRSENGEAEIVSDYSMIRNTFKRDATNYAFSDISTESGRNEHWGYSDLIAGAIQAIRNPNAHQNLPTEKGDAVSKLMLASLLMYKIDDAINRLK